MKTVILTEVRFQVLTAASMKMTALWNDVPIAQMMEAVNTFETSAV
jgi:hypothetical protein